MTTTLEFKNEGDHNGQIVGPLWINKDGAFSNYKDSETKKVGGGFLAEWFTLNEARKIAKIEGLILEE